MANSLPTKGNPFPRSARALDRLAVFRVTYVAVFALVLAYVFSVGCAGTVLEVYFRVQVEESLTPDPARGSVVGQIRESVRRLVEDSAWVRIGGVEVDAVVLGRDGWPIYVRGLPEPTEVLVDPEAVRREAERVLPAEASLGLAIPHSSLLANVFLVGYAAAVLTALYYRQRAQVQRQEALLGEAQSARDGAAQRAASIERELDEVRRRAVEVSVAESEHAREIQSLRGERTSLRTKLAQVEQREAELLAQQGTRAEDLESEHQALEELLDEALTDLQDKEDEIGKLQTELKRASKDAAASAAGRTRAADQLGRRMRALYKTLEMDDRALSDLVALRDEGMKLKAEEALKKLCDDVESAGSRRKVGGLPPGLPVFEIGYAGKGRIYYTHGAQRRLRVLCIGAKNTQKPDLEYLSRIVKA